MYNIFEAVFMEREKEGVASKIPMNHMNIEYL